MPFGMEESNSKNSRAWLKIQVSEILNQEEVKNSGYRWN